jgi:hypothetical protein
MKWAMLAFLFLVAGHAFSEESSPRESKHKAETAKADHGKSANPQYYIPPTGSTVAPVVNVFTGKHAGEESQCASPKDWKEWGNFAWCRSEARARKKQVYIFGRIYYRDIYQRPWRTKFCYSWEPRHPSGERFVAYEEYNDEDQDDPVS